MREGIIKLPNKQLEKSVQPIRLSLVKWAIGLTGVHAFLNVDLYQQELEPDHVIIHGAWDIRKKRKLAVQGDNHTMTAFNVIKNKVNQFKATCHHV